MPWIPMMLMFAVINALQGRYPLSVINVLNAAGSLSVLFQQAAIIFKRPPLLIIYSIILYTLSGFFHYNGTELLSHEYPDHYHPGI